MNSAGVHFIKIMITPFCSFINYIVSKLQSGLVKRWQSLSINVCTGPLCHILLMNSTSQRTTRFYDACILPCRHLWLVQLTQLSTIGDHSFPVAGARCWNGVPQDVTSAPSLFLTCRRLKSHLFRRCFHRQTVLLPMLWHYVISNTLIVHVTGMLCYVHCHFPISSHALPLCLLQLGRLCQVTYTYTTAVMFCKSKMKCH